MRRACSPCLCAPDCIATPIVLLLCTIYTVTPLLAAAEAPPIGAPVKLPPRAVRAKRPLVAGTADPALAASVVTGEHLRQSALPLSQVLGDLPGATVVQTGAIGTPTSLAVRGATADQLMIAIDDVVLPQLDGGFFDLADVPTIAIDKLELYRGTTPPEFGSQSIGGALRVYLRRLAGTSAQVLTHAGSYGTNGVQGALATHGDRCGGTVGGRWMAARGQFPFRLDPGTPGDASDDTTVLRQNSALRRASLFATADCAFGAQWRGSATYFGGTLAMGIAGPALVQAHQANLQQDRQLAVAALRKDDAFRAGASLVVSAFGAAHGSTAADELGELGPATLAQRRTNAAGMTATWQGPLLAATPTQLAGMVRAAADYGEVTAKDLLRDVNAPLSSRGTAGLDVALTAQRAPDWSATVAVGGRWLAQRVLDARQAPFDWQHVAPDRAVTGHAALSGWRKLTEGWTLTGAVHHANRQPNLQELFTETAVVHGNARLAPESALSVQCGVRGTMDGEWARVAFDLHGFYTDANNLIQLVASGPHQAMYQNILAARLVGAETAVAARLGLRWRLDAQVSALQARDSSARPVYGGLALPMRPGFKGLNRLQWQTPHWLHPGVTTAFWGIVRWQSAYLLDAANLVSLPARTTGSVGATVAATNNDVSLDVYVDNLMDASVFDLVGYPLPGRTVWLQIQWQFGPKGTL